MEDDAGDDVVVMTDPVTAINGETYERTALERLFKGKRRHGSKEQQVLQSLGPDRRLVQNWHAKVTIRETLERAARREEPTEAPNHFRCPVTHEIFEDPVLCADGYTYERVSIELVFSNHLEKRETDINKELRSPVLNSVLSDMILVENKFAKLEIAEFALQWPNLLRREPGALDDYHRIRNEREARIAEDMAEDEADIQMEQRWRPYIISNKPEGVLHPSPFPVELGEIFVTEVPRQTSTGTDMYFIVTNDQRESARAAARAGWGSARPLTLRSMNELARYFADIRYYQDLSTEKDVKRYLEKDLLFGHMLKKVFEPERFAGRPMLARWDGVWYAVRGQEVVVPARRVVIQYVETGETEEMSYREFCKIWRARQLELLEAGDDPVLVAHRKNAPPAWRRRSLRGL